MGDANLKFVTLMKRRHGMAYHGSRHESGAVAMADGTDLAARKLERVLTNDPAMGVLRHVAGYAHTAGIAVERGIRIPMREV
jgi:urocanate hydratase